MDLELAPGGRLVFLSDLHFTQRGPLADFQAGDTLTSCSNRFAGTLAR